MSSDSHFQAVFDAALKEYFNKTGSDIVQDPLIQRLQSCSSPEDVLGILQEQAQALNEFRQGGRGLRLMRKLKPTVDILFALSNTGLLGNAVGLVSAQIRVLDTSTYRVSSHSHFLLQMRYSLELGSYSRYAPHVFPTLRRAHDAETY